MISWIFLTDNLTFLFLEEEVEEVSIVVVVVCLLPNTEKRSLINEERKTSASDLSEGLGFIYKFWLFPFFPSIIDPIISYS